MTTAKQDGDLVERLRELLQDRQGLLEHAMEDGLLRHRLQHEVRLLTANIDEIERLRSETMLQRITIETNQDVISGLRSRVERLEGALRPFAELADDVQEHLKDDFKLDVTWAAPRVGDLRRARAALSTARGGE